MQYVIKSDMFLYDLLSAPLPGQLSQRMQIPGNMWVEVWQNAKPVPCRRQRRLFDDTKEAEKVGGIISRINVRRKVFQNFKLQRICCFCYELCFCCEILL